jgi:hypothetical protein
MFVANNNRKLDFYVNRRFLPELLVARLLSDWTGGCGTGLPDLSCYNLPKTGKIYQNDPIVYEMAVK